MAWIPTFHSACFHCLVFQVLCVLFRISQLSVQEVTEQRLLPPLLPGFDSGLSFISNFFFFTWNIHFRHVYSDSATAWSVSDDLGHCVCFNLFFYLFWELSIVSKTLVPRPPRPDCSCSITIFQYFLLLLRCLSCFSSYLFISSFRETLAL